ncbi:hypothetical protein PoMZ_05351 [Pyricularia oryzae]|nr:hypothetical protein PoMZ_05351 [Pyricularia oryzae]
MSGTSITDAKFSSQSRHSVYANLVVPESKPLTRQSSLAQLRQPIEAKAEARSRPASILIVPTQGSATPSINTPIFEKRLATRSPETPSIVQPANISTPSSMVHKESAGTHSRPAIQSSFSDSPNAAWPGNLLSARGLDYKLRSRLSEPALVRSGQKKPSSVGGHPGYTTPVPVTPQRPVTKSSVLHSSPVHHLMRSANTVSSRHSIATTDRHATTGGASQSGGTSHKLGAQSCPNRVAELRRLFDNGKPVGPNLGPSSRWKETSVAAAPHSKFSGSGAPVFRLPQLAGPKRPGGPLFSPVKNLSANEFGNHYGHGPGSNDGVSPGTSPLKQKITLFENMSTPDNIHHSSPSQQVRTYDGAIEDSGRKDTPHGDDSLRNKASQMLHPIGSASLLRKLSRSLRSETQDNSKEPDMIKEAAGTSRFRRQIAKCRLQQPQYPKPPYTLENAGHSGTALVQVNQGDKHAPESHNDTASYIRRVTSTREPSTSSVAKRLLSRRSMPFFNKSVHKNNQPYTRPAESYSPSFSGSGLAPPTPSARTTNSNSRSNASKYSFAGNSTMSAPQPRLTKLCNSASFVTEHSTQSAPQPLAAETLAKGRTSSLRRRFSSSLSRAMNPFRSHHGKKDDDGAGWGGQPGPGVSGGLARAVSVAKCDLEHPRPIRGSEMGQIIGMFEQQEASAGSAEHVNRTGQAKL